jgi:hypothetical protein
MVIIQLGLFNGADDRYWWCNSGIWDTRYEDGQEEPSTVQRPTEIAAFKSLYRQSRLIRKRGVYVSLSPLHLQALRLEYQAMSRPPVPDNIHLWVADRMRGVTQLQVKALLEEASFVILLRDVLGLAPLEVQWSEPMYTVKRAA